MIVRKIKENEYDRTQEVFSIAFEMKMDQKALSEERLSRIKSFPMNREEKYWSERWAAFDESGAMLGFLTGFPATVRFDGNRVGCTCIGGVSSLPQFRGRGAIAGCFQKHLADSYRAGHVISYLYPFSTHFYRKFGYEVCVETVNWTLDVAAVPSFQKTAGEAVLNEGNAEISSIRKVYDDFMSDYNLSFVREDCDWSKAVSQAPAVEGRFTYVWKNENGIPKGVMTFRKEYDPVTRLSTMCCEEFYFSDTQGLCGLLGHISSYRSHFQKLKIPLPKDIALERVLPEVSGSCRRELDFTGMGRIINAERAFWLARYQGSGEITIKLTDPCVAQNNRSFKVTFSDGQCVAVEQSGTSIHELDIAAFSRLVLGACGTDEIKDDQLKKIFYPKKAYIRDFF